jgi:hypothetical protein
LPLDHPVLQKERLSGYEFLYHEIFRAQVGEDEPEEKGPPQQETSIQHEELINSDFILHD